MKPYVMLFPGQGSQSVGMLQAHSHPIITQTLIEASDVLGFDVPALMRDGPVETLNQTENTQPVLLAASVALWRWWISQAPAPVALAGHSLGEYSALVAAESLAFADALLLVRKRGQLMQSAVPVGVGGMAAVVGLDDAAIEKLCAEAPDLLEPANYNTQGQVVVAGKIAALDWLQAHGKSFGARLVSRLPMSVPSHCSLLKEAAQALFAVLEATPVQPPKTVLLHNVDAQSRDSAEAVRAALRDQLYQTVRWTATQAALSAHADTFIECGGGKVLCGLVKRAVTGARFASLEDPAGADAALALLN
jgi:[acyl-carrier-protein] S-malonyltransferase